MSLDNKHQLVVIISWVAPLSSLCHRILSKAAALLLKQVQYWSDRERGNSRGNLLNLLLQLIDWTLNRIVFIQSNIAHHYFIAQIWPTPITRFTDLIAEVLGGVTYLSTDKKFQSNQISLLFNYSVIKKKLFKKKTKKTERSIWMRCNCGFALSLL